MTATAPVSYNEGQRDVEAMMQEGIPFDIVEDAIESADLTQDHKAALWLLAWSLRCSDAQRRDARLLVSAFARG